MNLSDSKYVVFDFGGTIANTLDFVIRSYNEIAPRYNCRIINSEIKEKFRRMELLEFFKDSNIQPNIRPIISAYITDELYKNIEKVETFPGIPEALQELKKCGYILGLMSSNSRKTINAFLKINNLDKCFNFIHSSKNLSGKDKVISTIIKKYSIKKSNLIYVCDEVRDIEAMKKINLKVIAVTWGFNSEDVLKKMNPDAIVSKPQLLAQIIKTTIDK